MKTEVSPVVMPNSNLKAPQIRKEMPIQRKLVIWVFLLAPAVLLAASGDDFYERLYVRGMADFRTGDYQSAYTELHKAAFGFLEQIEKFETAEIYAAIAANRLKHEAETRDALLRLVAAENIQPHFRSIELPEALREEVYRAAAALLTKKEGAGLGVPEQMQDAAAKEKTPVEVPTPGKRPNVAVTAPIEAGDSSAPVLPAETKPATPTLAPSPQPAPAPQQQTVPAPEPSPTPIDPAPPEKNHASQSDGATVPATASKDPQPKAALQAIVPMLPAAPQPKQKTVDARFADAQQALDDGKPERARSIYSALLREQHLSYAACLRLAEGLYRVRDFAGAIRAFKRVGAIDAGEERYHYYYAVALFETGHFRDARRELDAALPFIELTADVAEYRAKIEKATQ
jgi:tetratricopeptide (TPR) repeat protein